jgi:hypothetical protein
MYEDDRIHRQADTWAVLVAGLAERLAYFGAVTTTLVSCGSNPDELAWFATCHPAY